MPVEVIVALISLLGTLAGSFGGILVASKLTNYRIQQLENKVDDLGHAFGEIPVMKEQIKELRYDIEELKRRA